MIEVWEKIRCSILFPLLVPGGRWHTVMAGPVSVARPASLVFHNLVRYPFDPPPSRAISSRLDPG